MNFPCKIKLECGWDIPNYSAEGEEIGPPHITIVWPPPPPPPPGATYWAEGCIGRCLSYVSQEEADLCALTQAMLCVTNNPKYSAESTCAVTCPDGTQFTYVVPAGLFVADTQALADELAHAYACERAASQRICLSSLALSWCVGVYAQDQILVTGGNVVAWIVTGGSLPPGVSFNNGLIYGTPTVTGSYAFNVRAYAANGSYADHTYVIWVLQIVNTALPNATEDENYSYQLASAGGTAPYTYSVISGSFPLGISISASGLIDGICGEVGVFPLTIKMIDSLGRTCTKAFTLTAVEGCPTPGAVVFTVPATPSKSKANTIYSFENMAAIGPDQKIASWGSDTSLGCLDVIDFSLGSPAIVNQFLMNSETGWQTRGAIYEPVSGLIVAIATKALTLDRIVFFHPTTGYVSSIEIATTTDDPKHWEAVLMRGTSGQIAFYRGSFNAGDSAYIYIVNASTKTVVRTFTLPSPAPNIYGDGDFCYSCRRNEFYVTGTITLGRPRLYSINATTGATRLDVGMPIIASSDYYCAYIDSTDKLILKSSLAYVYIFDPVDGSVLTTKDLYYDTTYHALQLDNWIKYNFKLNALMVSGIWYTDVAHTIIASGVLFINATTLDVSASCKTLAGAEAETPFGTFAESNGDVYMQCNDGGGAYPFKQIRATII